MHGLHGDARAEQMSGPDRRSESLRKNLDLWRTWNSTMGGALHRLQVQILRRAAEVLRAALYRRTR